MQAVKPGGTREQTAVAAWLDRADLVRTRFASVAEPVPSLLPCFDMWTGSVASFGECELHARALDRSHALAVFEERRPQLAALVEARNEAGIEGLVRLRERFPDFGRELAALELDRDRVAEVIDQFEQDFRENLADWEMKGSDAKKLMDQFAQVAAVVRSEGLPALSEHLDTTFAELIDGRREPDRGTHDNMPWWKLMLLAGMIGWYLVGLVVGALYRGSQAGLLALFTAYGVIQVTHWIAFVLFC
jgi:hypothetical protein